MTKGIRFVVLTIFAAFFIISAVGAVNANVNHAAAPAKTQVKMTKVSSVDMNSYLRVSPEQMK